MAHRLPAALPPGWRRVWHSTAGRGGGYASYVGPGGRHARSIAQAVALADAPRQRAPPPGAAPPPVAGAGTRSAITVDDLADHVTEFDRPPTRRAPKARAPL